MHQLIELTGLRLQGHKVSEGSQLRVREAESTKRKVDVIGEGRRLKTDEAGLRVDVKVHVEKVEGRGRMVTVRTADVVCAHHEHEARAAESVGHSSVNLMGLTRGAIIPSPGVLKHVFKNIAII